MRTEGEQHSKDSDLDEVEENARGAVKCGGIMYANVHDDPVVPDLKEKVDVLVSIFTLESACQTYTEYCHCIKNMALMSHFEVHLTFAYTYGRIFYLRYFGLQFKVML
ncbi:unnamed protein product [Strongylus vulgaris]|uniref:Uncharacterized protein n=1 Tax=Strongylus vulgaris TaxID=40348 RepID=A0A3P7IKU1_STRVU|nr:unnamed protein product [Strongylus vulgaris]